MVQRALAEPIRLAGAIGAGGRDGKNYKGDMGDGEP